MAEESRPRLSIIIPTRDCLAYLPEAIASIRAQEDGSAIRPGEIEIVVVDDGSTDGTGPWLAAEAARDLRLVALVHQPAGVAAARNAGIAAATAEIIAFLDADDQYLPGALAERLQLMERDPAISLTFADVMSVDPDGKLVGYQFDYWPLFRAFIGGRSGLLPLGPNAFAMLLAEMVCGTSSVITRRRALEAVGGFNADLRISEDWDLWLKLAQAGAVWCSTRRSTRYLVRPGSTSRNMEVLVDTVERVFRARVPDPSTVPQPWRGVALARLHDARAELARSRGDWLGALREHLVALAKAPSRRLAREAAYDAARLLKLK